MAILEKIVGHKAREVDQKKKQISLETLANRPFFPVRPFAPALKKEGISVIAEMKRQSPSGGLLNPQLDPCTMAQYYQSGGADAVSVLTDRVFFGGSIHDIPVVKKVTNLPILRKEFIIDEYQLFESRAVGADAVLLIRRILPLSRLRRFLKTAKDLELSCLVEVHTPNELKDVLMAGAEIIGINNRNLGTLEIDLRHSVELKPLIPDGMITVSESGIKTREEVRLLEQAGFDAILVGEVLMKADHPGRMIQKLKGKEVG